MIGRRTAGHCNEAVRNHHRGRRKRTLLSGLALAAAISCGSAGWQCEVTVVMDGRTVMGTGSDDTRVQALALARRNACEQLGLDDIGLRRCEQGLKPAAADTWSMTDDCMES